MSGEAGPDGTCELSVEDDGPGLAPEDAERVLQRGIRLDESRPGSGLGLSIVADLVDVFGGEFRICASPMGGAKADVRLPLA